MSTLAAATRVPRTRIARHRAGRTQVAYVPVHDYIPAGVADLWKSSKGRFSR